MRETAYLMGSRGISLYLKDERTDAKEDFHFPDGVKAFVQHLDKNKTAIFDDVIHFQKEVAVPDNPDETYFVEVALEYTDGYQETIATFVNNINTHGGGTHLAGFRAGLTSTLNTYGKNSKLFKDDKVPSGDDFREGLTAVVSLYIGDPQFEGQTKDKLGNREAQGIVHSVVSEALSLHGGAPGPGQDYPAEGPARHAGPRGRQARPRPGAPQDGPGQRQHARQAGRLPEHRPRGVRALPGGG
jgi:DNA gyrase subunit B